MIIPEASLNTGITEESSGCRSRVCFFSESSDLKGLLQDKQFVCMVVILKWLLFQYYAHGFWCVKNGKRRISKGGKIKYTKFAMLEELGHQNKGNSSFTGWGLFVLTGIIMSLPSSMADFALCNRLLQKPYRGAVASLSFCKHGSQK